VACSWCHSVCCPDRDKGGLGELEGCSHFEGVRYGKKDCQKEHWGASQEKDWSQTTGNPPAKLPKLEGVRREERREKERIEMERRAEKTNTKLSKEDPDNNQDDQSGEIYKPHDDKFESVFDTAQVSHSDLLLTRYLIEAANSSAAYYSCLPQMLSKNLKALAQNFPHALIGASGSFKLLRSKSLGQVNSKKMKEVACSSIFASRHLFNRFNNPRGMTSGGTYHLMSARVFSIPGVSEIGTLTSLIQLGKNNPVLMNNEAINLVIQVMWRKHVRNWFRIDFTVFCCFYFCFAKMLSQNWIEAKEKPPAPSSVAEKWAWAVGALNLIYTIRHMRISYMRFQRTVKFKEIAKHRKGHKRLYGKYLRKTFKATLKQVNFWLINNFFTNGLVFAVVATVFKDKGNKHPLTIPLAGENGGGSKAAAKEK